MPAAEARDDGVNVDPLAETFVHRADRIDTFAFDRDQSPALFAELQDRIGLQSETFPERFRIRHLTAFCNSSFHTFIHSFSVIPTEAEGPRIFFSRSLPLPREREDRAHLCTD